MPITAVLSQFREMILRGILIMVVDTGMVCISTIRNIEVN